MAPKLDRPADKSVDTTPPTAKQGLRSVLGGLLWRVPREAWVFTSAAGRNSFYQSTVGLARVLFDARKATSVAEAIEAVAGLVGDSVVGVMDELGPLYGKAGQVALSRLGPRLQRVAEVLRLTRLYGDWPPMDLDEVESILDEDLPGWRAHLELEARPLGVASMAQVHRARLRSHQTVEDRGAGLPQAWIVKVLKPRAHQRLQESVRAVRDMTVALQPIASQVGGGPALREICSLLDGFEGEADLTRERKAIVKMHEVLAHRGRRGAVLRIPRVHPTLGSGRVLVAEHFEGVLLSDLVTGRVELDMRQRRKLARRLLKELLVQVFEVGLFHGDPHAGNLILLEDGTLGLFDWGLVGELSDADRKVISEVLRATLALDLKRLSRALVSLAAAGGSSLTEDQVTTQLREAWDRLRTQRSEGHSVALLDCVDEVFRLAEAHHVKIPEGLLMMIKSLLTIEGLARGIDPQVAIKSVAASVLWRAAGMGPLDVVSQVVALPKIWRALFR